VFVSRGCVWARGSGASAAAQRVGGPVRSFTKEPASGCRARFRVFPSASRACGLAGRIGDESSVDGGAVWRFNARSVSLRVSRRVCAGSRRIRAVGVVRDLGDAGDVERALGCRLPRGLSRWRCLARSRPRWERSRRSGRGDRRRESGDTPCAAVRDLETKQRPMSSMDPSRRACYAVAQTTYGVIVTSPINASDFTRTCQPSPATVGAEAANTAKPSPTLSVSATRHRRVVSY
jgi:hypothetical protein